MFACDTAEEARSGGKAGAAGALLVVLSLAVWAGGYAVGPFPGSVALG